MRPIAILLATILSFVIGTSTVLSAQREQEKPNFLLVVVDDMGWTDLGIYGSEIDTPNINALAATGLMFTDFHASMSCSPTRAMMLTGTDNHIAGIGNMGELLSENQKGKPGYEGHLNDRVVSLAEVLQDNGYTAFMAGKWHLGHEDGLFPADRGFDRAFSLLYGGASHWSDHSGLMEAETPAKYSMNGKLLGNLPSDFYSSRSYTDFLMDAIREGREGEKPFFVYLAFSSPHDPVQVPEPWLSKYRGKYDAGYEVLKTERARRAVDLDLVLGEVAIPAMHPDVKPWDSLSKEKRAIETRAMEVYAGMVENVDYHFGRMVKFLDDIGERDNTIIIFLSDNGSNPFYSEQYPGNADGVWLNAKFDNGLDSIGNPASQYAYGIGWGSAGSGPLNLFKLTPSEGGIRIPLLISGLGITGRGKTDAFSYIWDLMPTILDAAGIEHPTTFRGRPVEPMRGRSLLPLLRAETDTVYSDSDPVGGELANGKWMRKGDYKIVSVAPPYGDGNWSLYDLAKDPGETTDLSMSEPEILKDLVTAWDNYAAEVGIVLME